MYPNDADEQASINVDAGNTATATVTAAESEVKESQTANIENTSADMKEEVELFPTADSSYVRSESERLVNEENVAMGLLVLTRSFLTLKQIVDNKAK